jgi:hypothetical protein
MADHVNDASIRTKQASDRYHDSPPEGTQRLEVKFTLRVEDVLSFQDYHLFKRAGAERSGVRRVGIVFLLLVLAGLLLFVWEPQGVDAVPLALVIVLTLVVGLILCWRPLIRAATKRNLRKDRSFFRTSHVLLTPEAVQNSRGPSTLRVLWEGIERIAATETHLFLYISSFQAIVVPGRAFASEDEFDDFIDVARYYRREARRLLDDE